MTFNVVKSTSNVLLRVLMPVHAWRLPRSVVSSVLVTLVFLYFAVPVVSAAVSEEYQVKAAFISNFARFVTWPGERMRNRSFVFLVLGENPFGNALEPVNRQEFKGRTGFVEYRDRWNHVTDDINVLFISRSMKSHLGEILHNLKGRPVLTISDVRGFSMAGGMIEFTEHGGSIHFIINLNAVREAGLEMNFQLLQLADRVIGK